MKKEWEQIEKDNKDIKTKSPKVPWIINQDSKNNWFILILDMDTACSADFLVAWDFFATSEFRFYLLYILFYSWSNFQWGFKIKSRI